MQFLLKSFIGLGLVLLTGFFLFVAQLPRETGFDEEQLRVGLEDHPKGNTGIVVFTGGSGERIEKALTLYQTGLADRVLISGTHPRVNKSHLASTGDFNIIECCVDLGPRAQTTIGNALETRDWARKNGYDAILLVTSEFHLPRARIELSKAAPELEIMEIPVASRLAPEKGWVLSPKVWNILAREYVKFLLSWARSLT